jgi:ribulose-phosphate 3-epimerase
MISAMPPIEVAPSILAADHGRVREQVQLLHGAGARVIHVDVMDGHFVPPLALGPGVVAALRDLDVHLEVHLMVDRPERTQIAAFAQAGAGTIIVHAEATPHIDYALAHIREAGCLAGVALTPSTALEVFSEVAVDIALLMTVNPGWGGQAFIPSSLDKIARLRALLGPGVPIEVDGGIDERTAGPVAEAGATRLVAGTAIFGAEDPVAAYARILQAAGGDPL